MLVGVRSGVATLVMVSIPLDGVGVYTKLLRGVPSMVPGLHSPSRMCSIKCGHSLPRCAVAPAIPGNTEAATPAGAACKETADPLTCTEATGNDVDVA